MELSVVACGPGGFAGASRIMCDALTSLARMGINCRFVGPQDPFHLPREGMLVEREWPVEPVSSAAIGPGRAVPSEGALFAFELAEALISAVKAMPGEGVRVIWAHYLYPYAYSAVLAARLLHARGLPVETWLTPAGSDIWEIGPQLQSVSHGILNDAVVSRIIAYSTSFASEVRHRFSVSLPIDVVVPSVSERFRPIPRIDRDALRRSFSIADDDFVISHHSNMRPVKALGDIVDVSRRLSAVCGGRRVVLALAGPEVNFAPYASDLTIRTFGIVHNVERLVGASDVELNLSRHDSFNMSLAEAMAAGTPVVTTDIVGIAEHIKAAGSGFVIPLEPEAGEYSRDRYSSAATALLEVLRSGPSATAIGRQGADYAAAVFSARRAASAYCRLAMDLDAG